MTTIAPWTTAKATTCAYRGLRIDSMRFQEHQETANKFGSAVQILSRAPDRVLTQDIVDNFFNRAA